MADENRFGLTPAEQDEFDRWANHQRETNLREMANSALVMSVYPRELDDVDIAYALQVGACVLLDKPLLVLVSPGQQLPAKLAAVADQILEVPADDVDTGSPALAEKVQAFIAAHVDSEEPHG